MEISKGKKLTIVTQERDRHEGKPQFEAVLELLSREGIAAAFVTRGIAGFSGSGPIHTTSIEVLSYDLPVVIEAGGESQRIDGLLPSLLEICPRAMVDVAPMEIVKARIE